MELLLIIGVIVTLVVLFFVSNTPRIVKFNERFEKTAIGKTLKIIVWAGLTTFAGLIAVSQAYKHGLLQALPTAIIFALLIAGTYFTKNSSENGS